MLSLAQIHILAQRLIQLFTDALDLHEFFQRGQRAVDVAVFDDAPGKHRPDFGNGAKLLRRGGTQVNIRLGGRCFAFGHAGIPR